MSRGYFGIGVYHPKTENNIGTLWRAAYLFGASFIFTIGRRYQRQASDTPHAWKSIPLWHFEGIEDFKRAVPLDSQIICVEQDKNSHKLPSFIHPERAVYLLGAEDTGIPVDIMAKYAILEIPVDRPICMNVAMAGSIVIYDRFVKSNVMKGGE